MELENSFDPTPKLKSSPVPILFVSFNEYDENCINCGDKYIRALFCSSGNYNGGQRYCKKCLSSYITEITDNKIYLDVYYTMNIECSDHEISRTKEPQNIQESCRNCLEILCFKQIPANHYRYYNTSGGPYHDLYKNMIESEKYCKLCRKSLYQGTDNDIGESQESSNCVLIVI